MRSAISRQRSILGKPAAAGACRQAVVNHAWSFAISRVLSVMMPCASVLQNSPPGPAAAPGTPGAGGFSPCPYAPVTSAEWAYSPGLCPVRQGGQGGSQAPRPLDQSHDCANGCDARVIWGCP